jgi:hypothetical protein
MKIIMDLDNNQLHYIRAIISKEIDSTKKESKHSDLFEEYRNSLIDILDQLK